jgi:hypothetical protein
MALLGYHSDLIAAALGHVRRDITSRHYIRTTREPEVRTALEAWSRRLQGIITGEPAGKVIPLRA